MSVMLVTMGSVITHFFWSPLQQEQLADGRKVRFGTRSGRYGRDVESTINASFAISTMGLRVVGAGEQCSVRGDRIRGELVHGWAKQGRLCGSAFRCGVLRGGANTGRSSASRARQQAEALV